MEGCASPESTRPGLVGTDHLSVPIPLAGGTLDDVIYPENHLRCFGGGNLRSGQFRRHRGDTQHGILQGRAVWT